MSVKRRETVCPKNHRWVTVIYSVAFIPEFCPSFSIYDTNIEVMFGFLQSKWAKLTLDIFKWATAHLSFSSFFFLQGHSFYFGEPLPPCCVCELHLSSLWFGVWSIYWCWALFVACFQIQICQRVIQCVSVEFWWVFLLVFFSQLWGLSVTSV